MAGDNGRSGGKPGAEAKDESFLGRWSRRKAEAKTAEDTAPVDPEILSEAETPEGTPATQESGEPPAFDPSTLPDIDSLGPGSDFSMFMQAGVPPALKTKALRKLWRVKPELANLDGLIDYGEDLTGSFKVVDHLKTAYEVGRGFLKDQADQAPKDGDDATVAGDDDADSGESEVSRPIAEDADADDISSSDDGSASKT